MPCFYDVSFEASPFLYIATVSRIVSLELEAVITIILRRKRTWRSYEARTAATQLRQVTCTGRVALPRLLALKQRGRSPSRELSYPHAGNSNGSDDMMRPPRPALGPRDPSGLQLLVIPKGASPTVAVIVIINLNAEEAREMNQPCFALRRGLYSRHHHRFPPAFCSSP